MRFWFLLRVQNTQMKHLNATKTKETALSVTHRWFKSHFRKLGFTPDSKVYY